MLRYVFRALAACASIAAFTLFAAPASVVGTAHDNQQYCQTELNSS